MNADTNATLVNIGAIVNGRVYSFADLGSTNLSIVADPRNPVVTRVVFRWLVWQNNEKFRPFAMNKNSGDMFYPVEYLSTSGNKQVTLEGFADTTKVFTTVVQFSLANP